MSDSHFEWFFLCPQWLRVSFCVVFLVGTTLLWLIADVFWVWGYVVGFAMLCFAGKTESEKSKYHF